MDTVTIGEAATQLRAGQITSVELLDRCLETIARLDDTLNAFITVDAAGARVAAGEADRRRQTGDVRGPLDGIPVSVKDLIDVAGLPTTAASRARSRDPAAAEAAVVTNLRRAGAVIIGKCNLHEFAWGTTGEESAFGPTRNPHAPSHMAGGSSSGSAVSVAAGMALASIGTDTGGSIRIPSAACGVVGLKPSFGDVSCDGVLPLAPSLDHVGPIGLTIEDVARVYSGLVGHPSPAAGARDGRSSSAPVRFGLLDEYFLEVVADDVRDRFQAAVERVRAAGAEVRPERIAHASHIQTVYLHTQLREAAAVHRESLATRADAYGAGVRQRLESAAAVTEQDYERAQQMRATLRADVDDALDRHDVLLLPTLAVPAPPLGTHDVVIGTERRDVRSTMLRLTQLFNLTGHPAVSLPCGVTSAKLPCGAQLVGPRGRTPWLLDVAARFEQAIRGTPQPS